MSIKVTMAIGLAYLIPASFQLDPVTTCDSISPIRVGASLPDPPLRSITRIGVFRQRGWRHLLILWRPLCWCLLFTWLSNGWIR
jgi:hypothetical protein